MEDTSEIPSADAGLLAIKHADALRLDNQLARAVAEYHRALGLDETRFEAWHGLGLSSFRLGAFAEAVRCFRRALALEPGVPALRSDLGNALFYLGEVDAALENLREAAEASEGELRCEILATIACIVPGSPLADNASILEARRTWAKLLALKEAPAGHSVERAAAHGGKLRVGYCSKFFHARSWMKPVFGVINHHDRSILDLHLFSDGGPPGPESGYRAHPLDRVHDARGTSNAELADLVARIGIDILVDLNGYSYQHRLGVFTRRPAPVNIGWFNMYATSGIDAFDYVVGDEVVIPASEEQFYCERVLRVPGSYLAYSVLYPVPEVALPPSLAAGHITFGSLCSQYKITDDVIAAWAAILRQAPDAHLLIRNAALGDPTNRTALHERFGRCAIDSNRILLGGPAPHKTFLATYARVDIALDTFPYNGGTTTMEALWQGVPVLTFNGDRWASRQGCSLLLAAGLDDWCMPNRDAYIDRAITLARSPTAAAELASLRSTMRGRLACMPVCDSAGLCHALERIYRDAAR